MGWRTVVVSKTAKLDYKMGYLCIRSNEEMTRIHLSEISVLMIETTAVSLTAYLLVELANQKIDIIFCDTKHCPHGKYIPFYGSHDTSQKIRQQICWSDEIKKSIWKCVVEKKILGQSSVLKEFGHNEESEKLDSYIPQIESGDSTNREGHAAKVYFNSLFGKEFTRTASDDVTNAALNYGYSILMSTVAKEIVNDGYLTQIGIFHDNMFNEFNLACDLMEPFRPFIDYMVLKMPHDKFEHDEKMHMMNFLNYKVIIDEREQFVGNAISIYVKTILNAIDEKEDFSIKFPSYEFKIYASDCIL